MNIRWTEEAAANLEHISLYLAEDNLEAALKTVNTILRAHRAAFFLF